VRQKKKGDTCLQDIHNILNADEVAKLLRISKRTLLREVEAGKLEAFKVGKSLRFTREAVEDYINKQKVHPGDTLEDEHES